MKNTLKLTVTIPVEIKLEDIVSLLVSAMEGGSNYWIDEVTLNIGDLKREDFTNQNGKYHELYKLAYESVFYAAILVPECSWDIMDAEDDNKKHTLSRSSFENGLKVMSEKYPHHFNDILAENSDAITGDVFLQCCLFGDVLYS